MLSTVGSRLHRVFAIRPRPRGALTLTVTFSMAAGFVALWYDKLLMGSVGSIRNDTHRGSYLEFVIFAFRKFMGLESGFNLILVKLQPKVLKSNHL